MTIHLMKAKFIPLDTVRANIASNVSRLGEVAEHKTSLGLQMFKLKIECQTKH
jgi:hypothetical protein